MWEYLCCVGAIYFNLTVVEQTSLNLTVVEQTSLNLTVVEQKSLNLTVQGTMTDRDTPYTDRQG